MSESTPPPPQRPRILIEATFGTDSDGRKYVKCCSDYQLALFISVVGGVVTFGIYAFQKFHS